MKKIIFSLFLFTAFTTFAQKLPPATKLAAFYAFNDPISLGKDSSDKQTKVFLSPNPPKAVCGIAGGAIELTGEEYVLMYDIGNNFATTNFTISLYFKPTSSVGIRDIFTNLTDSCSEKRAFAIQYDASARQIKVKMKDEKRGVEMSAKIDNSTCWQHIVFVRDVNYHRLYINGIRKTVTYTSDGQRVNLSSNNVFSLGKSGCDPKTPNNHLKGLIDEVRIYNAAVTEDEAAALYYKPDRIKNQDKLIFIGQEVKVSVENTCATKFSWFPTAGVSDPDISNPTIKPNKPGIYAYNVRFTDLISTCAAYDTIKITVIDPSTQPCGEVYLPNAFTPNGDDTNELFGIDNYETIDNLTVFEVLDRWGGILFSTTDPTQKWDGKSGSKLVQPGTYFYRLKYKCQGTDKTSSGSFILIQ
jgi:gliding motility-associated-like protein